MKTRIPHILTSAGEKKSCARCGGLRFLSEYQKKADSWDGLGQTCKTCLSSGTPPRTKRFPSDAANNQKKFFVKKYENMGETEGI